SNLQLNDLGVPVWKHAFDWEYRDLQKAGWYSALSQGQGVSLLCRAHRDTGLDVYLGTAQAAFRSMTIDMKNGGVRLEEGADGAWLEEAIVAPPTHILNGFLWALWGVYDYAALLGDADARGLLEACVRTVRRNVASFDCGFWSLYEHSGTRLPMLASAFYHGLHISQLSITARLLDMPELARWADRWQDYTRSTFSRRRAFVQKAAFKLLYY